MNAQHRTTLQRMREWLEKIPERARHATFPNDVSFASALGALQAVEQALDDPYHDPIIRRMWQWKRRAEALQRGYRQASAEHTRQVILNAAQIADMHKLRGERDAFKLRAEDWQKVANERSVEINRLMEVHASAVIDKPDHPVAAPCAVEHCMFDTLMRELHAFEKNLADAQGDIAEEIKEREITQERYRQLRLDLGGLPTYFATGPLLIGLSDNPSNGPEHYIRLRDLNALMMKQP